MNNHLPAGLQPHTGVELFTHNGLKATYNSRILSFTELPNHITRQFVAEFNKNTVARESLINDMGITNCTDAFEKYMDCNYGNFDHSADMINGNITKEIRMCGKRGNCPSEGKVCQLPAGRDRHLTVREFQVLTLVSLGKFDQEISDLLSISLNTVKTHVQRIRECMGFNNRVEIAHYAYENKLINQ